MRSDTTEGINPAYDEQSGYEENGYPPDWTARAKAIRRRDDYICQDCGTKSGYHTEYGGGVTLDVHHIQHLSDGGSNRGSNLTTLCIDCHNDRHDHDIREGREDYQPAPSVWDRLRQLVYSIIGGAVVLPIHGAGMYVLLTQSVGSSLWLAGLAYLVLLAIGVLLRPGQIAALYGLAGGIGVAIMQMVAVAEIATVSTRMLVLSLFVPALLAGAWWWRQR